PVTHSSLLPRVIRNLRVTLRPMLPPKLRTLIARSEVFWRAGTLRPRSQWPNHDELSISSIHFKQWSTYEAPDSDCVRAVYLVHCTPVCGPITGRLCPRRPQPGQAETGKAAAPVRQRQPAAFR